MTIVYIDEENLFWHKIYGRILVVHILHTFLKVWKLKINLTKIYIHDIVKVKLLFDLL